MKVELVTFFCFSTGEGFGASVSHLWPKVYKKHHPQPRYLHQQTPAVDAVMTPEEPFCQLILCHTGKWWNDTSKITHYVSPIGLSIMAGAVEYRKALGVPSPQPRV